MPRALISRRRASQRGYILITVLLMSTFLLLASAANLSSVRSDALRTRAEIERARSIEFARSGLNVALADLGRVNKDQIKSKRDGSPVTITMGEGQITYQIYDEAGKMDIRNAPIELLGPALEMIGKTAGIDAFAAANLAQELSNRARNDNKLTSVPDMLRELGLSGPSVHIASRYLTSLNFTSKINPRTASPELLAVIPGIGPSDVDEIVTRRESNRDMPRLGTATAWLDDRESAAYTIVVTAKLTSGVQIALSAQVIQQGLSFRNSRMSYDIMSISVIQ